MTPPTEPGFYLWWETRNHPPLVARVWENEGRVWRCIPGRTMNATENKGIWGEKLECPPQPQLPPLPRRFRAIRKQDGKMVIGSESSTGGFAVFPSDCGAWSTWSPERFHRTFTITEWIDSEEGDA